MNRISTHSNIRTFEHSNIFHSNIFHSNIRTFEHSNIFHSNIRTFEHSNISRRGSALLIVLGMLSFMVISAVGFSIYMRQSRVPSSHLRREATARYLLKSALANAVSRLNGEFNSTHGRVEGVYDDAYPGLNDIMVQYNGDYWVNRVFTPFGMVSPRETVSTLTLEGLGYIPPALINEVRLRSRTTRTAKWTNLAYDLGRYAFCAVDVSDCFDINKLRNVKRRTSHAGERISLSSLYPEDPDTLVNLLKSKANENEPYVSIADFNIAIGNSEFTPFVRYINNQGNNGHMYLNDDEAVSNALFITDTWFPATNAYLTAELELKNPTQDATHYFDLSTEEGQPFAEGDFEVESFPYIPCSKGLGKVMQKNLGGVGLTCLYDYLDEDQIPMSLALPTVEAVPMVCGVNLAGAPSLEFEKGTGSLPQNVQATENWTFTDANKQTRTIERKTETMFFKGATMEKSFVSGTVMFPFKRMKSDKRGNASFQVEALVAVFFGPADLRCRLTNEKFRPTKSDWQNGGVRDGIVFYKGEADSISFNEDITKTEDAFKTFKCRLKPQTVSMPAFYIVNEREPSPPPPSDKGLAPLPKLEKDKVTVDGMANVNGAFMLFDREGAEVKELTDLRKGAFHTGAERSNDALAGGTATLQGDASQFAGDYTPYIAVWVRVVKGSDAVDLAPAVCEDDEIHISGASYSNASLLDKVCHPFSGDGVPLLDFKDTREEMKFKFSLELPEKIGAQTFDPQGWKSLYAVDPRYNFAPEDWISSMDVDANPQKWRDLMKANNGDTGYFGADHRDRDIFMFTSDQEHLQSIGELQFLPYVQELGRTGVSMSECEFKGIGRYHGRNDFDQRTGPTSDGLANRSYFWRTYSGYRDLAGVNPYYDLMAEDGKPVEIVNGSGDFRVNPLSSDPRVLSAAVFDTPWDYYVASTNRRTNKAISSVEGSPESYAFGTAASISADRWDEKMVNAIASRMRDSFYDGARTSGALFDWGIPYENLWTNRSDDGNGTGDDQQRLFNVDLGSGHPLHGVDRKFLFSYWRECFQNRQQLFLIFLRAEPLTVGGAGGDSLANSQLGARGVALVWRDPAPPKPTSGSMKRKGRGSITTQQDWRTQMETQPPHRTRVLFYHQFD